MKVRNARARLRHGDVRPAAPIRPALAAVILSRTESLAVPQPQLEFVRPAHLPHEDVFAASDFLAQTDGIVGYVASVRRLGDRRSTVSAFGSCVLVAPGLAMTATHVIKEALRHQGVVIATPRIDGSVVLWEITQHHAFETVNDAPAIIGASTSQTVDVCLVAVALLTALPGLPLRLPHFEVARPQIGERLWALGFREYKSGPREHKSGLHNVVSSGIVSQLMFGGRDHVPSACVQVEMTTPGGMSGGPVFNSLGHVVGVVSKGIGEHNGTCTVSLIWPTVIPTMQPLWPSDLYQAPLTLPELSGLGYARLHGTAHFGDGMLEADVFDPQSLDAEADLPVPLKIVGPPPLPVGLIAPHRRVLACVMYGLVFTNFTRRPLTITRIRLDLSEAGRQHKGRLASVHVGVVEDVQNCVMIQRNENGSAAYQVLREWQSAPTLPTVLQPMIPLRFDSVFAFDDIGFPDRFFDQLMGSQTVLPDLRRATLVVDVEGGSNPLTFQVSLGPAWSEQFESDPTMSEAT